MTVKECKSFRVNAIVAARVEADEGLIETGPESISYLPVVCSGVIQVALR